MNIIRRTGQMAALSVGLFLAMPATNAIAQGNYNDNRYNNNGNGYNNGSNNGGYNNNYNDDYSGSYQDFYDALSPYGEWINDPDYGYVWVPDVDQNFRPYSTNGYWAMTNYGNTWVSNYNWGWATFHYGRWTFDNYYGWVWIPGNEWAPAWVNWRNTNNGYYGWAPMGPGSINYYSNDYYGNSSWWVFAPQQYLYSQNVYNYVRSPRYNNDYLRRSTVIRESQRGTSQRGNGGTNGGYFTGPGRADVERAIGHSVPVMNINDSRRAGATRVDNNKINIFRPNIRSTTAVGTSREIRPAQVQEGRIHASPATQQAGNVNTNQLAVPQRLREANPREGGNGGVIRETNGQPRNGQMTQQADRSPQIQQAPRQQQIQLQEQQRNQQQQQMQEQQRSQQREQQRAQQLQQQTQQQQAQQQRAQQQQQMQQQQQVQQQRAQQQQQMQQQREQQQVQQQRAQQQQQMQQHREQQRAQQQQQQAPVQQQMQEQRRVEQAPAAQPAQQNRNEGGLRQRGR